MKHLISEKISFRTHLSSKNVALIGVFASIHAVLYFIPSPLWRNWAIYLEPVEGIVLGPLAGSLAAFIGSVTARLIRPDEFWMFGLIAEPIGVLFSGLLAKGRWKQSMMIYSVMLTAYFIHPFGRLLPLWTILDVLISFTLIYPVSRLSKKIFVGRGSSLFIPLAVIAFITSSTDSLVRIFLLIPAGLYNFFGLNFEVVYIMFVSGAVISYIEDAIAVAFSLVAGSEILAALKKFLGLSAPLS
jgi:hypothetical protein